MPCVCVAEHCLVLPTTPTVQPCFVCSRALLGIANHSDGSCRVLCVAEHCLVLPTTSDGSCRVLCVAEHCLVLPTTSDGSCRVLCVAEHCLVLPTTPTVHAVFCVLPSTSWYCQPRRRFMPCIVCSRALLGIANH